MKYIGQVSWFNPQKGYGFIVCPAASDRDIFVHCTKILDGDDTLGPIFNPDGSVLAIAPAAVEFELDPSLLGKGAMAVNVRRMAKCEDCGALVYERDLVEIGEELVCSDCMPELENPNFPCGYDD